MSDNLPKIESISDDLSDVEWISEFLKEKDYTTKSLEGNTIRSHTRVLNKFWLPIAQKFQISLFKFSRKDFRKVLQEMHAKKYSPATIQQYFHVLSALYSFRIKELDLEPSTHPIQRRIILPSIERRKSAFIPPEEQPEWLAYIENHLDKASWDYFQDILLCALPLATGMRAFEIKRLNITDITEGGITPMKITLIGKGNKQREVYIKDEYVIDQIHKWYKSREIQLAKYPLAKNQASFFINEWGERLSYVTIWRRITEFANLAGFKKHISPHKLRHTFASTQEHLGLDSGAIQRLMGHSSLKTTEGYLQKNDEMIQSAFMNTKPFSLGSKINGKTDQVIDLATLDPERQKAIREILGDMNVTK